MVRSSSNDVGDPGSNPALGKQRLRPLRDYLIDVFATPTLPDANLRYQEALDWRKWTKGACSFPQVYLRSFDRAGSGSWPPTWIPTRPGSLSPLEYDTGPSTTHWHSEQLRSA